MEYTVVYAESIQELVRLVNDAVQAGWRPQGGVSVSMPDSAFAPWLYAQAMIRG
jgi:predicted SAM-dependent methyltransferase